MKKILSIILAMTLVLSFAACSPKQPAKEGTTAPVKPQTGKMKIGFVVKVINPFFTVMIDGAKKKAEELNIELLVGAASEQTKTEEQIAIVQDMTAKGVKAICIAPMDSEALLPCLSEAQKAGITVVNLDNRLNPDTAKTLGMTPIPFVGVSDENSAYLAAKAICEKIGGAGKVAIIEGIQSADNARQRKNGAERAFGEYKNIELAASQTANWNAEEALSVVTNILQANPDIKGIFCANDAMSFGAIQAISAAGKSGEIAVASIDAEAAAIENVKTGAALATVYNNQDTQAAAALKLAVDIIGGAANPEKDVVVDTILYTKDNLPA